MRKVTICLIVTVMISVSCSRNPKSYIENGKKYFAEKK